MMMSRLELLTFVAMLAIVILLTGCATTKQTEVVNVPVIVPCLGPEVTPPEYKAVGAYPGDASAIRLIAGDLIKAKDYASQLLARMAGCR